MGTRAEAVSGGDAAALLPPALSDGYDSTGKSPERIAADIVATRAELDAILDALEHRLALRQLLERGMDMLKDTMSGDGGGFGEMLRGHPVPVALIGMGVGWLAIAAAGRTRPGEPAHEAGREHPPAPADLGDAPEKAAAVMDRAQQTLSDTADHARQAGKTAWRQASELAEEAAERFVGPRRRAGLLMAEHPLAFGALALLAGAAAALLLPKSAAEERLTGSAGAGLRQQAASLGRGAMARAQQVAERTLDAAKTPAGEAGDAVKGGGEAG
ncbi:MAG: DUF3618 domain-containing protein [Stellaceae bacterium]